ncbi:MAG: ABC transporter transmembrane domain-containing protein [Caulobacteraceae bacterium]
MRGPITAAVADRPKRRDIRPLAHLAPLLRAHWVDAAWSVVFLVVSTGATLGLSGAARLVADKGFSSASPATLNRTFLILIAVAGALAAASALRFYFNAKLGERIVADLRGALFRHVLTLDQGFFLDIRTGEVLSRLTTDTTIVESMVGASASVALRSLFTFIGAVALMMFVSPRLTLVVALLAPVVLAALLVFGRRVRGLSVRAQERFAETVAYAGETLDGLDTLQAFGREMSAGQRFSAAVETAFEASLARNRDRALMTGLAIALVFGGVTTIFWLGAHAVVAGTLSAGALLMFAILAILAAGSVGTLGEVWGDVQKAAGAMERIAELLAATPAIAAPPTPRPLPSPARGEIAFEGVVFAYPGRTGRPALNGFDLTARPGERVALVGPSGAGKTTVLRLALRFYDPQGGVVRLDGVDVRAADPTEVRVRIALFAQDAPLFSGSALENLRFGREDATADELLAAARAAEAQGFIDALPRGFDTLLGERAKTLSGGQRQRLAIARALVRRAPILLLDEATSALDAENERLVQRALHDAMSERTTLVIAHRLATVLKADRIVVMDEGRVVDSGTHGELSARGGLYARLAQLQFGMEAA